MTNSKPQYEVQTTSDKVEALAVFPVGDGKPWEPHVRWGFSWTVNGERKESQRTYEQAGAARQHLLYVVTNWNFYRGERGGGNGRCYNCNQRDELNFDLLCMGCE